MLPFAGDRAVARPVTVADHEKSVVMERVRDAVLALVVGEVVVETRPDVAIYSLQLYKDERQPVHEADQIRPLVVVRDPHALNFQLAYSQEAVVLRVSEINDRRM